MEYKIKYTGVLYVEAETEKEAIEKAYRKLTEAHFNGLNGAYMADINVKEEVA